MSTDFPFKKTEFNFYAVEILFGKRSPRIRDVSAFMFDILRKVNLKTYEREELNTDNRRNIIRHIELDNKRRIETSHTDMGSGINRVVTYIDTQYNIHIADTLFSEEEYEYFEEEWPENLQSKIKNLGIFIEAVYKRDIEPIPILINEFPNISEVLLEHPEYWVKGEVDVRG